MEEDPRQLGVPFGDYGRQLGPPPSILLHERPAPMLRADQTSA